MLLTAAWAAVKSSESRKAGALFVLYLGIMHGGQSSSTEVRAEMDLEESQCPPPPTMRGCQEAWSICRYHHNAKWGMEETLQMVDAPSSILSQRKRQLSSSDMNSWSTLSESRSASFPPVHPSTEPEGR